MSSAGPLETVEGFPSWIFACDRVEAALTREGGHLAPVRFHTARGVVQPFAIAPWAGEAHAPGIAPVLRPLRGDFFCAPFGGNARAWRGERHPAHGETASARWDFVSRRADAGGVELTVRQRTRIRPGEVVKRIGLHHGETNVYCRHELRGFSGPMPVGHHAMLEFRPEYGPGRLRLSAWHRGRVCPLPFEAPEAGGYQALRPDAPFRRLERVPLATGGHANLSVYSARPGFEDLVMVSSRVVPERLAWTTVLFPEAGWLWFTLKDPRVLASTILWHSNGGRHYAPWNGRHRRVLGLEEVTSYFHFGLAESAAVNPLAAAGVPTALRLRRDRVTCVDTIMGVVALPDGFDRVAGLSFHADHIVLRAASGVRARHPVRLDHFSLPVS